MGRYQGCVQIGHKDFYMCFKSLKIFTNFLIWKTFFISMLT